MEELALGSAFLHHAESFMVLPRQCEEKTEVLQDRLLSSILVTQLCFHLLLSQCTGGCPSHHPHFFTNAFQTVSFDLMMEIVSRA